MVNTWKIVVAALVIFASGVLTGALSVGAAGGLARLRTPQRPPRPEIVRPVTPSLTPEAVRQDLPSLSSQPPGAARLEYYRRLERELDLDSTQQERLHRLVEETDRRLHAIWDPLAPQAREALRDLRHRIKTEVLRPEQRAQFDRFSQPRGGGDRQNPRRSTEPASRP